MRKNVLYYGSLFVLLFGLTLNGCSKTSNPKNDTNNEVSSNTNNEANNDASNEANSESNNANNTNEDANNESLTAVTFTDALGREVTVDQPKKVAALMGSFAEVWVLSGGELAGVTDDAASERNLTLSDDVALLGTMQAPNVEALIDADIDFVILSSNVAEHVKLKDTLELAGINCAFFNVESFEDYLSMLKICTDITGDKESYTKNGENVKAEIEAAIARKPEGAAPTVLFLRAFSTGIKAKGSDSMTGIMLKDMGCINIADSDESLLEDISMEKIIEEDPDYIFVVTMGSSEEKAFEMIEKTLISNTAWSELKAVKENHYVVLPKQLFHLKPNNKWGASYEILADILYGEN